MRVLRFILEVTKPFRLYLWGIFAMMIVVAIDANARPYLIKYLIDSTIKPSPLSVWYIVAAFATFEILKMAAWSFSDSLVVKFYSPLRVQIISVFTDKISHYPYVFFQNRLSGSIVAKIGDAFNYIHKIIFIFNYEFLQFAFTVLITLVLLAYVHVLFALGLLLWIATFLVLTYFGLRNVVPLSKTYAESKSVVFGHLADYLSKFSRILVFVCTQTFLFANDLPMYCWVSCATYVFVFVFAKQLAFVRNMVDCLPIGRILGIFGFADFFWKQRGCTISKNDY